MKIKFTWHEWYWTQTDECLLTLNKEDDMMYRLVVALQP